MPPAAAIDCKVVLFDVNCTRSKEDAVRTLMKVSMINLLSASKDMVQVFFVNTDRTDNPKGYSNIAKVKTFNPRELSDYIMGSKPAKANWLEAVALGLNFLIEQHDKKGIITLQLLFITDFSTATEIEEKKCKKIINAINDYNIFLYIVGPDVNPPQYISSAEDINEWKRTLIVEDSNESLAAAKQIVKNTTHSVICNYQVGVNLFYSYKRCKGSQPWQVPLGIGTKFELPASTVRLLKEEPPFKLQCVNKVLASTKWVVADEECIEVKLEDIVKGVTRHNKFVKIENDVMFRIDGPRSFTVMGFTDSVNVPEYYMQSDASYYVLPDMRMSQASIEVFSVLVDQLAEAKKYVIVRRVYNRDNKPKFLVMVPKPAESPKCFMMVELPYADNIKYTYADKDMSLAYVGRKIEEIHAFLDSMNVNKKGCQAGIPLAPNMMYDVNCMNIVNKVEEKWLRTNLKLENVDLNYLKENENDCVDAARQCWPVRQVIKTVEKVEDGTDDFDNIGDMSFDF